jgi:hypothetical protein
MNHSRRGFVLVLVLVVILLAGMGLARHARGSARAAIRSASSADDLQRKWATATIQRAVLPQVERLIQITQAQQRRPVPHMDLSFTLASMPVRLRLADEQAKANINTLSRSGGISRVRESLWLLQSSLATHFPLKLSPRLSYTDMSIEIASTPYVHYDQFIGTYRPAQLIDDLGTPVLTDRVTCWGTGKLNVFRAAPESVKVMLKGYLKRDAIAKLLQWRDRNADGTLTELMREAELSADAQNELIEILCDYSMCHSLHIRIGEPQRRHHVRFIRKSTGSKQPDIRLDWSEG